MATCSKCNGQGLIGNGPVPTNLEGATRTCPDCGGTGNVDENATANESAAPVDAPVDNPPTADAAPGGILKRIFG